MGVLANIFTWWNGASFGTRRFTRRNGKQVGEDGFGNIYWQGGRDVHGKPRRWVIYNGSNDISRVPPEWYVWLTNSIPDVPDRALPAPRPWQREHKPNMTGTVQAYMPPGSLEAGGKRAAATGDYEAWNPEVS